MATEEQNRFRGGGRGSRLRAGVKGSVPGVSRKPSLNMQAGVPKTGRADRSVPITQGGNHRIRMDAARAVGQDGTRLAVGVTPVAPTMKRGQAVSLDLVPEAARYGTRELPPGLVEQPETRISGALGEVESDELALRGPRLRGDERSAHTASESRFIEPKGAERYLQFLQMDGDISAELEATELAALSDRVLREFQLDDQSRDEALKAYDAAMEAARAKVTPKDYPFEGAANMRYPLLNSASLQFAARAYPAIIRGSDVVLARVNGQDPDGTKQKRAERVARHMSYQCREVIPNWESQIDELLHHLPLAGTAFRCIYWDAELGQPVTELVTMKDFVLNNEARSLKDCPRFTRIREYYPYEISERMQSGFYRKVDDAELLGGTEDDSQKPQVVYEQHRREDLDGDGYVEPYVVTVHKASGHVLRVVPSADIETLLIEGDEGGAYLARAQHEPLYVRYIFMPDPEGRVYGVGFGKLLQSVGSAINTVFNQILDAAHLQNAGGGFLGGNVDFGKKREIRTKPGEWRQLKAMGGDIRAAIVPHQWPGPNPVLFNVLGLLVEAGKEVASINDVLTGASQNANMPVGTVHALVEQGLQQFTAIYKRIYRSLTEEYRLLYRLNGLYLGEQDYFTFQDGPEAISRADYRAGDMDITPVSDPGAVTSAQRLSRAEFALRFKGQPHMNDVEIDRRALRAASVDDVDGLFAPPVDAPQPDPQVAELALREAVLKLQKLEAEVAKLQAESLRLVSEVEGG